MDVIANILAAGNEKEKIHILQHPLIETFLRLKWTKIRQFFFLLIYIYVAFVLFLSAYVILLIHQPANFNMVTTVIRYFVIVTSGGLTGHAIIQGILTHRHLFRQYELGMFATCTTLSLVVALQGELPKPGAANGSPSWVLHACSIAVLLAWTELMLLIGRLPTYGYYALMFSAVLQNVLKVLFTFVCLVIGFALSFSIQFHSYEQFTDPWRALVKTTVMMMGEFEYADLFADDEQASPVRLPATSRVIFLLFIILASIVLMNLMVGVAVSDIQGLKLEGHSKRLEKQAEFLRQMEKVISFKAIEARWFPTFIRNFLRRKRCIPLKFTIQPEHAGSSTVEAKKAKKLPCELIELIMETATRKKETEDLLRNPNLQHLIQTLKNIIHIYENRNQGNNNYNGT